MLSTHRTVFSPCTISQTLFRKCFLRQSSVFSTSIPIVSQCQQPTLHNAPTACTFATLQPQKPLKKKGADISSAQSKSSVTSTKKSLTYAPEPISQCQGCGTPFQSTDPSQLGYQFQIGENLEELDQSNSNRRSNNRNNRSNLTLKDGHPVANSDRNSPTDSKKNVSKIISQIFDQTTFDQPFAVDGNNTLSKGLCQGCQIRETSLVDFQKYPHPTTKEVISKIPSNGTIIHVISGQEFPASYIKGIKDYAGDRKVIYVVTKSDLSVDEHLKTRQRFLPYVQSELHRLDSTIQPDDVFAVAINSKSPWGIRELYNSLPLDSYLVGLPNTGKSALAHALGTLDKSKLLGGNLPTRLSQRSSSISFQPLTTKHPLSYVNNGKRVTDLPAIDIDRAAIFNYLRPKTVESIVTGNVFIRRLGLPATVFQALSKENNVVSLGGLVFVRMDSAPPGVQLIFWCTAGDHKNIVRSFSELEIAVRNSAEITRENEPWFVNKSYNRSDPEDVDSNEPQEIFTVNITSAGADFGILGFGPLFIQTKGPVPKEGVKVTFFAKKGIEVHKRTPALYYMKSYLLSKHQDTIREMRRRLEDGKKQTKQDQADHKEFRKGSKQVFGNVKNWLDN